MAPPGAGVEIHADDSGLVLASWRSVFVNIWRGTATVERLERTHRESEAMARRHPDGFVTFAVLRAADAASLAPDARAMAEKMSRTPPASLKAIAQVIEGDGFAAAAVRSLAAGMMLLGRSKCPSKIFDGVDTAAAWLAPRAPGELARDGGAVALVRAVELARRGRAG